MPGAPDCEFNTHRKELLEAASIYPPTYVNGTCLKKCRNRGKLCGDCWYFSKLEEIKDGEE